MSLGHISDEGTSMNWNAKGSRNICIATAGHAAFAASMITLGILGLINRNFAPTWQPVPKSLPAREALAYLCNAISLLCGIGLLWRRTALMAARLLFAYLLLWLLLLRLPLIFVSPTVDIWWASCQTSAMTAAAWVLYAWFDRDLNRARLSFATGDNGIWMARILYGLALIPFGIAHFIYLQVTADLVPPWLPAHVAWTYFTGYTFIAAGVAIVTAVYAKIAAALVTLQMGLFTFLIWVPVVTHGANSHQRAEFIVSCALTAAGWVIADSYNGLSWLAPGKRRTQLCQNMVIDNLPTPHRNS